MEARKQAYLQMIDEAAAVERVYAKKNKEREYNVAPVAPPQRTIEEQQNDLTMQKQVALANALKFLSSEVAGEFTAGLGDEDLLLFNRYADDFAKEVKRFKSVDILFLKALWSRYLEKMGKTYGIDIPLEKSDIKAPRDRTPDVPDTDDYTAFVAHMRGLNPTMTDRQIQMMYANEFQGKDRAESRAAELQARRGEAEARYMKDRDVVEEVVLDIPAEKDRITFPHLNEVKRNQERIDLIEQDMRIVSDHLTKLLDEKEDLIARDEATRAHRGMTVKLRNKRLAELEQMLQDNAREITLIRGNLKKLKRDRGAYAHDSVKVRDQLARELEAVEEREAALRTHPAMRRADPREELDLYYPYGLEETRGGRRDVPDQDSGDDRFNFRGYGIRPAPQGPTLVPFGRYLIHRPSLQKRELRIRFRSKVKVPKFPDRPLPARVAHAIEMALSSGKMTTSMTQGLTPQEKNLLALIGNFTGIEHPLQHTDEQDELERFELLRGEVCAGNDNPAIVKELKQLVLRFLGAGRLKQMEGQRILAELALL